MTPPQNPGLEVVRGRIDDTTSAALIEFWTTHGALSAAEAEQRLAEVICVMRDTEGAVTGVNSAYQSVLPHVGGRTFWIYRSFAPGADADQQAAMLSAARDTLKQEFVASDGAGPIGICLLVTDRATLEAHPDAVWAETGMIYAGYTADGAQVRINYFEGARV